MERDELSGRHAGADQLPCQPIGLSVYAAYTSAVGGWFSIGVIDESAIEFGREVSLVWGEPDGGTRKPTVEPHIQTEIRATMTETARG